MTAAQSALRTTEDQVRGMLEGLPLLTQNGFVEGPPVDVTDAFIHQVDVARGWCENPPRGGATEMRRVGSYWIKHRIEAERHTYISHPAAIVGACLAGWWPVVSQFTGPTCVFRRLDAA